MEEQIRQLRETFIAFYGDALRTYPELLIHPLLNSIEADMRKPRKPVDDDQPPETNPIYRILLFLSEYRDCIELPSYEPVREAHEAFMTAATGKA